jgi:hypothetical protein
MVPPSTKRFFAKSVRDQKGAIEAFRTASRSFRNDPDMQLDVFPIF